MGIIDLNQALRALRFDRSVPGFARTHVLHARGTSPFGQFLSDKELSRVWEEAGGTGEPAPWFLMGSRDTPTGTLWHLAFTPPLPGDDLAATPGLHVLAQALWVHRLQADQNVPGWALIEVNAPDARWIGLWDGARCVRLTRLSAPAEETAELAWQQRRWPESFGAPRRTVPWLEPNRVRARELLDHNPQAELLDAAQLEVRQTRHARRRARLGLMTVAAFLVLVTLGLWGTRTFAQHRLHAMQERTRSLEPDLERLQRLSQARALALERLTARPHLLNASPATSRWLGQILSAAKDVRMESLRLESTDSGSTTVRLDLEVDQWSQLNPLLEALQKVPGVHRARYEQQSRQENRVRAQVVLEGRTP